MEATKRNGQRAQIFILCLTIKDKLKTSRRSRESKRDED